MDIFKDKFEQFHTQKLREEKERRFYKETIHACEKKCINFTDAKFTNQEKECFKNCASKTLKGFLPIYESFL